MERLSLQHETIDSLAHATALIGRAEQDIRDFILQLGVAMADTVILDASTDGGIKDIHGFARSLMLSPQFGDYRLGVIQHADLLTSPAQNALLKLLEEPPERVKIILEIPNEAAMLPTLLSRTRRYFITEEHKDTLLAAVWPTDPLDQLISMEDLAKEEQLDTIVRARLIAQYESWVANGRPQEESVQIARLFRLAMSLQKQTNRRLLLEEFVVSSL